MEENKFERQWSLPGITFHCPSGCGTVHCTVNFQNGKPVEVYSKSSASGGCSANMEAIGRLVSIALQDGVSAGRIIDQLCSVRCPTAMSQKDKTHFLVSSTKENIYVRSCSDAIGKAISWAMKEYGEKKK
jgi:ribonucleoside-diphosphate reductase alpha chain